MRETRLHHSGRTFPFGQNGGTVIPRCNSGDLRIGVRTPYPKMGSRRSSRSSVNSRTRRFLGTLPDVAAILETLNAAALRDEVTAALGAHPDAGEHLLADVGRR